MKEYIKIELPKDMSIIEKIAFASEHLKKEAKKRGLPLDKKIYDGDPYYRAYLYNYDHEKNILIYKIEKTE